MNILIVDGQGGGVGKALVEGLRNALPKAHITAVGANSIATAAMLRAGADAAATGENSVVVCSRHADIITGPIGIIMKDSMLGEITGLMATAITESTAHKILIPSAKCAITVAGARGTLQELIADAVATIVNLAAARA